jgi:hypothetical protein
MENVGASASHNPMDRHSLLQGYSFTFLCICLLLFIFSVQFSHNLMDLHSLLQGIALPSYASISCSLYSVSNLHMNVLITCVLWLVKGSTLVRLEECNNSCCSSFNPVSCKLTELVRFLY